ncbi:GNAT family N-acetyltransferase [Dysgonomonas sp. Marseille-P4677]|uniref:GNAT family N-acetyltransferase n=1 Tax=Dysgonomonas sp. Marseille-P4677 TaxID=2364790 RepID=UPI0019129D06|nr:GNAT family N-acetyltransferase [Dysgonomonas sp. Marseille-P4677]MBK5719323.1 GNAT family N-acetyltransferase [Dysgonomonas sp. Marseille-P4677]
MRKEITWKVNDFKSLTTDELYAILHLRCKVFVIEQNAPYLDTDYNDPKAVHIHGYIDNELMAYCRLFRSGDYYREGSLGRVIVAEEFRKYGYGHDLMKKALEIEASEFGSKEIVISAQAHLQNFYRSHGFISYGEPYLEDGIPHIRMKRG